MVGDVPLSRIDDGSLRLGDECWKKPQGTLNRGAWRWRHRVQGKVRVLWSHLMSFVSHLYLLPLIPAYPAFHHCFIVLSPLLLAPLTSLSWLDGFIERLSSLFNNSCFILKGGPGVGWGWDEAWGTKHLITGKSNTPCEANNSLIIHSPWVQESIEEGSFWVYWAGKRCQHCKEEENTV